MSTPTTPTGKQNINSNRKHRGTRPDALKRVETVKRSKEETNRIRAKFDKVCLSFRNASNHTQRQRALGAYRSLERRFFPRGSDEYTPSANM